MVEGLTMNDPQATAERMLSMYKNSPYTPEERVSDHAFAYDSKDAGRKFWIEVLQIIYRIKDGGYP
jgi:hypothetical protein